MSEGRTCSGDVTRVAWGQTHSLSNPGLACKSVPGLYFPHPLLIPPCSCQDLAEVAACIPPAGVCEPGGRPGSPTAAIVLLGPPAVCIGLPVSLATYMQTQNWAHRYLKTFSLREKVSLFFFCSNSLIKIKHNCTHKGSLDCVQRHKVCVRGAMNQALKTKSSVVNY